MLQEADLARVKVSVSEQQMRQQWRVRVLWGLRILSVVLLLLLLRSVLVWPFADFEAAVDQCLFGARDALAACVQKEMAARRAWADAARVEIIVFVGVLALNLALALRVRFDLKEQLRQHVQFSEQVFDAVPLPLSLRTPAGLYMRVNREFEQRFGLTQAQVVGRHYAEFFPPRIVEIVARMDALALASTEAIETEIDLSEPGKPLHAIQLFRAVRDRQGAVLGLVIIREDITDLRVSHERLRQLSAQMLQSQEDERRRIARDLHDQVGQILTALKMQIGLVAKRGKVDDAASALLLAREFAEEALRHTRDLSASLHPHLLDDLGLEPALNWLIDRFIRPLVATVDLRCRLSPARGVHAVELVAFRVVQEALTNAARHAQATRIGVIVESADGHLSIEVIDDGVGFDGADAQFHRGSSLGLAGMNDRVAEFGGEVAMESTPGVGTRVRAKLPWALEEVTA